MNFEMHIKCEMLQLFIILFKINKVKRIKQKAFEKINKLIGHAST